MNALKVSFFLPLFLFFFNSNAQTSTPILLENPSFEDIPRCCEAPRGWKNCGSWLETPPDIQPGFFKVQLKPSHGGSFLGLVTRDNNTWESVGQQLTRPLEKNLCYQFSLDLAHSPIYYSVSRSTGLEVNFIQPTVLRIWGGYGFGDKKEKLAETKPIKNSTWQTHNFKFSPKKGNYTHLLLEAFYVTPNFEATNGHILIDNASAIIPISCQTTKPLEEPKIAAIEAKKPKSETASSSKTKIKEKNTQEKPSTNAEKVAETLQPTPEKWRRENLKKDTIIPVENIFFQENRYEITKESEKGLQEILRFLTDNPDIKIEVGGHTNLRPDEEFALQLSSNRAEAVANWLFEHQIDRSRVTFKGYGKSKPLLQGISKNANEKNQRVEIKILVM